ncbi:MAG: ketoacyl-ACP synthase III [Corynebacteriales bacterium]|nr:ketoacyl-ACP synthase III [Mycobacteriales bacterium]
MSYHSAVLSGLGTYLPKQIVTNREVAERLGVSDEWIYKRTGISRRHRAAEGQATSDLAVLAGEAAFVSAGMRHVDAVIVATSTPDHISPATAPEVAARLGCAGAAAFDVGAVCSGFIYGLATATGLISAGIADSVLMIGADTFSTIVDPHDRATAIIFGDGAGAMVLRRGEATEPGALGPFDLGSGGEHSDLAAVRDGGSRHKRSTSPDHEGDYFRMNGREMYSHAVEWMTESSRKVLARTGWSLQDVDHLVAHQANARILATVAQRLGIAPDRCVISIEHTGNTVAASIPLALAHAARAARLRKNDRVLLTAFGAGLTWGSVAMTWPHLDPST